MTRQVIEDFRRGRWQRGFGRHTLRRSAVPLAAVMPFLFLGKLAGLLTTR
jgi:hypothetical protein